MAIRVLKFEVFHVVGDSKAIKAKWRDLATQTQEAINCVWQTWETWHVANKTPRKLRRAYEIRRAWHHQCEHTKPQRSDFKTAKDFSQAEKAWRAKCKDTEPEFPKLQAIPQACAKVIYDELAEACPTLHASTRELTRNITQGKITSGKATNGNIPKWQAILLCRESRPSSTRKQPIPFTKKPEQTELVPPDKDQPQWRIRLRLDRVPPPPGGKRSPTSEPFEIVLWSNRRGMHGQTAILRRILAGTAELKGSALVYDDRRNKWFVHISYEAQALPQPAVNPDLAVTLVPLQERSWALVMPDGHVFYLQGDAEIVRHRRMTMLHSRWGRQENYRYAQRAGKGHGVNRAMNWKDQFARDWRDLCTTLNHDLTSRVLRICQERGIGRIIYYQPEGWKADTRLLATAGKVPGRRDSSGWAWYQVASQFAYKLEGTGITCEVRKWNRKQRQVAGEEAA